MTRLLLLVPVLLTLAAAPAKAVGNLALSQADRFCVGADNPAELLGRADADGWRRIDADGGVLAMMNVKGSDDIRRKDIDGAMLVLTIRSIVTVDSSKGPVAGLSCGVMDDSPLSAGMAAALEARFGRPGVELAPGKVYWIYQDLPRGRRFLARLDSASLEDALPSGPVTVAFTDDLALPHGILYRRLWLASPGA